MMKINYFTWKIRRRIADYTLMWGQKVCQNIANSKKRLEYVDLMKGICITLVVATHCGVCIPHYLPLGFEINMALINIRMPLYFSLSGFFFKEYMSFSDFVVRKVHKLIVPYVFFAIFPYALLFVIWPETIPQNTQGIYIPLCLVIEPMNGTLWFLRALFLTYLLYYAFHRISHSWPEVVKLIVTLAVALLAYVGTEAGNKHLENNTLIQWIWLLNIPMAFMALPYFYVAEFLRNHNILSMKFPIWKTIVGVVLFSAICLLTAQPEVSFKELQLPNLPLIYIASLSGIMVIWLLAVAVNKLPFVSYCARYSLIILGTQSFFFGVVKQYSNSVWVMFLVTMALAPVTIWIFKKYFPYFTAQKDLFPVGDKLLKRKE